MLPFVISIDASITNTGLCCLWADGDHREETIPTDASRWAPGLGRFARYQYIVQRVLDFVPTGAVPKAILIENYSYGSKGQAVVNIGELGGMLRHRLLNVFAGVPLLEISPSQLKRWATSKGNADKTAMAIAVLKRWGFESKSNDVIDAFALAMLGACLVLGQEPAADFQREVLANILAGPKPKKRKSA